MPDIDIRDIINLGDWDGPENAIKALMQRVAAGRDIFDHGVVIGKAVTLYQPYASFMAANEKLIETRSWSTNYPWNGIHPRRDASAGTWIARRSARARTAARICASIGNAAAKLAPAGC